MFHNKLALLLLVFTFTASATVTSPSSDYLSPELREQVEALKQAVSEHATTAENYPQRVAVAWKWLNAHALNGGHLPVEITSRLRPHTGAAVAPRMIKALDFYVDELTLLDEQPNALGTLVADLGPHEARSWVTLEQRYTVGEKDITAGGGFLVAKHFLPDYPFFQVNDPAADNYISISSSNPDVTFSNDSYPLAGMHGGFRGAQPALVFRVASGVLTSGDVVTIRYGDTSAGSRGFLMNSASTDFLPLPIYLAFSNDNHFYSLPVQPIQVSGTSLAGVHGFAPSVVRPGEEFEISVRSQDRFYNRAKGPIPSYRVYANDKLIANIPESKQPIALIKEVSFKNPGVYRIRIESGDNRVIGGANPILVSEEAERIFWGDTHGHSGFAEGIGTPDRFMQWAKDDARLDFVTHSEHDIWMDDAEWQILIDSVERYSEPGQFTGFLGYEWTTANTFGGHHNVLYRNASQHTRVPNQFYPTLSKLYNGLRNHYSTDDVLVIPHAHQAGDYRQSDPELQNLVEIMSQHGTFEWFGRMYLQRGHRVGFIAASDSHLSQPGYTGVKGRFLSQRGGLAAVMAESHTRDNIFDAMKSLSTYAVTGDKIILDIDVNGAAMGEQAEFSEKRVIQGRVIGTAPIDTVTLFKNNEILWVKDYLTVDDGRFEDEEEFYVTFESSSLPMHLSDNPRGVRGWHGKMEFEGATVVAVESRDTDFLNPESNRLEQDDTNPKVIHFVTGTRGDISSIKLKLKDLKRNARVNIELKPALEHGSPTRFRPPKLLAATTMSLSFSDLENGITQRVLPTDIYSDTVTLRRIVDSGEDDISFYYEDVSSFQGDYYYLRVRQANDAMAWSSPIWVGGIAPK